MAIEFVVAGLVLVTVSLVAALKLRSDRAEAVNGSQRITFGAQLLALGLTVGLLVGIILMLEGLLA